MASFISNIVGGILGANAAGEASDALQQGANTALSEERQNQLAAQQFQQGVWTGAQQNEQPYQSLGSTSANALRDRLAAGFSAPSLTDVENTPGYQFQLEQGTNAINENAAATGNLLTGNTGVALQKYGQGLASTTYNDAYQRALQTYMANLSGLEFGTNAGLSSSGTLASAGQAAAGEMGNIDLTGAQQQAQQINNAAAARASGYLGQAAGYGQMAGGIASIPGAIAGGIGNMSSDSSFLENAGNFLQGAG